MISIARHFSSSSNRLMLYTDRAEWSKAVLSAASGLTVVPDLLLRPDKIPASITRKDTPESGTLINAPGSSWSFRLLPNQVSFLKFAGIDSGDLTDAALSEMDRLVASGERKASWFLDLRDAQGVAAMVLRLWCCDYGLAGVVRVAKRPQ